MKPKRTNLHIQDIRLGYFELAKMFRWENNNQRVTYEIQRVIQKQINPPITELHHYKTTCKQEPMAELKAIRRLEKRIKKTIYLAFFITPQRYHNLQENT